MKNSERYKNILLENKSIYGCMLISVDSICNNPFIAKNSLGNNIINVYLDIMMRRLSILDKSYNNTIEMYTELKNDIKIESTITHHEILSYDCIENDTYFVKFKDIEHFAHYVKNINIMLIYVKKDNKVIPLAVECIGMHDDTYTIINEICYRIDIGEIEVSINIVKPKKLTLNSGEAINKIINIANQYKSAYELDLINDKGEKCTNISINKDNKIVLTFEEC